MWCVGGGCCVWCVCVCCECVLWLVLLVYGVGVFCMLYVFAMVDVTGMDVYIVCVCGLFGVCAC